MKCEYHITMQNNNGDLGLYAHHSTTLNRPY